MATENSQTSPEEKFFGVKTTIEVPPKNTKPEDQPPPVEVEVEDSSEELTAKPAGKPDKSGQPKKPADDDLSDVELSERVQKRIKHLTWEREEANREKAKALELQNEAIRAAQALAQRNQEYQNIISSGEGELVERIKQGAAASAERAKMEYRQAYETGDTERMLEAHEKLIAAQTELREAHNYDANYQQRRAQAQHAAQLARQQQMARQFQPQQPQRVQPTQEAKSWAEENPWFGDPRHRDMTAIAIATHETLIRDRGFAPDSDAYYEELNAVIRSRFPEYFNAEGQGVSASARKPATVVASAKRGNGAPPRKIKLTPTAVALAKKLGLTLEQYADQVMKGQAHD